MGGEVQPRPGPTASHSTPSLTAPVRQCPNVPANSRQSGPRAPLTVSYPAISLTTATVGRHRHPQKRLQTAADPASTRIRAPTIHVCYFLSPLPVSSPRPSLSIGGFGFRRSAQRDQYSVHPRPCGSYLSFVLSFLDRGNCSLTSCSPKTRICPFYRNAPSSQNTLSRHRQRPLRIFGSCVNSSPTKCR